MIAAALALALSIAAPADDARVDAGTVQVLLSAQGAPGDAHAHVILDRGPALEAKLGEPLLLEHVKPGPHALRAVLCTPDHVSLKVPGAFALSRVWVGPELPPEAAAELEERAWPDPRKPLLTLVSPQGAGAEDPPSLDVYVAGAQLSRRGYKVRVVLDKKELPLLTEAAPRKLRLAPGRHRITVDLLDRRGTKVSAFNRTDRWFETK